MKKLSAILASITLAVVMFTSVGAVSANAMMGNHNSGYGGYDHQGTMYSQSYDRSWSYGHSNGWLMNMMNRFWMR